MKVAVYTKFGPPEVLQITEVETPQPKDNEVLIRIHATTVEKEDPGKRKAPGFNGLFKPKHQILGMELAREVEAVGSAVTRFKTGDRVFGNTGMGFGAYAEYICLPESGALAKMPQNLSFAEAAVQIAKYYGAHVTGVCSTANIEAVRSFGADEAIDYSHTDFVRACRDAGRRFDVVFDVAGKTSYRRCAPLLEPNGTYLATVPTPAIMVRMLWSRFFGGRRRIRFVATGLHSPAKKALVLELLRSIAESGHFRPRIDRSFPLEQIAEAHRYIESGQKNGTVVVWMN